MIRIILNKSCLIIVSLSILFTFFYCTEGNSKSKPKAEQGNLVATLDQDVRQLLRYISNRDLNNIVKYIPEEGIIDADSHIDSNRYAERLIDPNDPLAEVLFGVLEPEEVQVCKEGGGTLYVSPYQYCKLFKEDYSLQFTEYNDTNIFHVKFEDKILDNCLIRLWPIKFKRTEKGFRLYGLLFE